MKQKYFIYTIVFTGALLFTTSCNKSFLDTQPKGQVLETNYYQNANQAYSGLIAAYASLGTEVDNSAINWYCDKLGPLNSAADECYTGGGGSTDMGSWQAWNNYTLTAANGPQAGFWGVDYAGIYRANLIIQKLTGATISDLTDANKARYIGEAKFIRAYFYFELIRLFKNIPLITTPLATSEWYTVAQAKPADVYAQIEKDLNDAITALPAVIATSENGRVTKGAAMALLGKAILFQNNTARMQEAAGWFEKVSASGVYALLPKFSDIFSPDNKFNKESIFEIVHSAAQNAYWGQNPFSGNIYTNMIGPRSYSGPTYWSGGWSFNPIIAAFAIGLKSDPRYTATVADIDSLAKATGSTYTAGYANTGYFIQKLAPLAKYVTQTGQVELNFPNDYIEIRLADVYLMEAEALVRGGGSAATAQSYLDKVRARVGLPSIPATLDNIYNERKIELATEGHRFYDLVRTGKAAAALSFKGFKAGTHELLPIPLTELNNTKLVQNPGY